MTFYWLPKTHKQANKLSGQPIVSGINNASILVDTVLRPHVQALPSFIKDTSGFLRAIEQLQIPEGTLLITVDVKTLYNSIPHKKGITTIKSFLDQMSSDSADFNQFVLELLEFILAHNVFLFDGAPFP